MKRALLVLALAVYVSVGCRAIGNRGGCGCGDSCAVGDASCGAGCGEACETGACGDACATGGCGDGSCGCANGGACNCPLGGCNCFGRFNGNSGSGAPGPYDCSACNSPNWGNTGYGYCPDGCRGMCGGRGPMLRNGYCLCCGSAAHGCCCASGDHNYNFAPGPPVGQTAYPYYTVRGPRDFLLGNPPKIGPY